MGCPPTLRPGRPASPPPTMATVRSQQPQEPPHFQGSSQILFQDLLFSSGAFRMGEEDTRPWEEISAQHPSQTHLELRRKRQEKETMSKMMVR